MIRAALTAVRFLTAVPLPPDGPVPPRAFGRSVFFFPVIGCGIGAAVAAVGLVPGLPLLRAALALTLWVGITGGLHLDGLADASDAWRGGGNDRERALAIMKDPRCGSFAVVTVATVLILKTASLTALFSVGRFGGPIWAAVLGRAVLLPLLAGSPAARSEGLAATLIAATPRAASVWGWVILVSPLACLEGRGGLLALSTIAVLWAVRSVALRRYGGVTGDVCGAMVEITETLALVVLAL